MRKIVSITKLEIFTQSLLAGIFSMPLVRRRGFFDEYNRKELSWLAWGINHEILRVQGAKNIENVIFIINKV